MRLPLSTISAKDTRLNRDWLRTSATGSLEVLANGIGQGAAKCIELFLWQMRGMDCCGPRTPANHWYG